MKIYKLGRIVNCENISGLQMVIDLTSLSAGQYVLKVILQPETILIQKL